MSAPRDIKADTDSGKIRHCVFIRFKPETKQSEKDAIYSKIVALEDRVEGMLSVEFGKNVNNEGLDHGYTEGFIVDFVNFDARDRYLIDEEHQKVGAKIVAAAVKGRDGVFVFDLQL